MGYHPVIIALLQYAVNKTQDNSLINYYKKVLINIEYDGEAANYFFELL